MQFCRIELAQQLPDSRCTAVRIRNCVDHLEKESTSHIAQMPTAPFLETGKQPAEVSLRHPDGL
jgi:hypothetical protein